MAYKVSLEQFEGPLDLLLALIEERKLYINDISLAKITDDYLSFISTLEQLPLQDTANFILVASTLVLIKSRSLLPLLPLTEGEEEDIASLEARLRTYKRIKELSFHTRDLYWKTPLFFREFPRDITPIFSPTKELATGSMFLLMKNILRKLPRKEHIPQLVLKKVISLEEVIEDLTRRMMGTLLLNFSDFVREKGKDKTSIIVGFLAMLELVRRGVIMVKQERHLDDIHMRK